MGGTGWYIGLFIGLAAVFVIVICVANILSLARRISGQARELALTLKQTKENTDVLHALPGVNKMITDVYGAVGLVRSEVLEGGK
jgi:hypothetical protein